MNLNLMLIKLQTYLVNRRANKLRICYECNEEVLPLKEVSVLNILIFVVIGLVIFFITKDKVWLLSPVVLSIINSLLIKPKCPKCKSKELRKI